MTIALVCPGCKARLRVAAPGTDTKHIKCPKCGQPVRVIPPGARSSQQRVAAAVSPSNDLDAMQTRISQAPPTDELLAKKAPAKSSDLVPTEDDSISNLGTVVSNLPVVTDDDGDDDWLPKNQDEEVSRLSRRGAGGDREAWRIGLHLQYVAACVLIVAFGALLFAYLVGILTQLPKVCFLCVAVGGLLFFTQLVAGLCGQVYCCSATPKRGVRNLARAGVVIGAMGVVLFPTQAFKGGLFTHAWLIVEAVRLVVFLLFARASAQVLSDKPLAWTFRKLLFAFCGVQLLAVVMMVVASTFSMSTPGEIARELLIEDPLKAMKQTGIPFVLAGAAVMMLELGLFAWYTRSLVRLIEGLDAVLGRRESGDAILWKAMLGGVTVLFIVEVLFAIVMSATTGPWGASRHSEHPTHRSR